MTYRAFIAIELPPAVEACLRALQQSLRPDLASARWTRPEGIHLTLKFLGDILPERVPEIIEAMSRAARGCRPFSISLQGLGVFPNPGRAKVLWVGAGQGAQEMTALAERIEAELEPIGFPRENRPFAPHFTLARFREHVRVPPDVLQRHVEPELFEANEIILFRSQLQPAGAVYTPLGRVEMAKM